MKSHFEVIGVSSEGKILKEVEKSEGIRVIPVNMTRTITPIKDFTALVQLYFVFKKEKPFIVHSHTPKAGTLAMIASKFANVPHRFHTIAGMPLLVAKGNKRKLLDFVEKITYKCATKIYPNSNGLKDIVIKNKYAPESKVKVIGNGSSNGIDTSYFNPSLYSNEDNEKLRKELNIRTDDFVFTFVGRLVGDKGVNEIVNAFYNLNKDKAKLLLLGYMEEELDPLNQDVLDQIKQHPNIMAVGFKNDVRPYYAISDALTFPSYREGFPNVVMQACSMNLNCIVSDINGCNEIIENGVNGWIVPVKNTEKLKEKMIWCLDNIQFSKTMGEKSRKKIIESYERKFVWNEILNEYKKI
ncbi:glycosyltransferase family 4 protein [Tenacibaculum sp. MAR_2010_89]|uniref:glycosyltransferase family 4 protein n=1 Tax=Tenacibaculum sp. MAR_2010_89 TaxID=1250198 RepID=UPI0015A4034F|nr:glycosyltransferase family 4 protein [Tenacibaculum sp. MAR_2010_89]